jgi:hypothetical protein
MPSAIRTLPALICACLLMSCARPIQAQRDEPAKLPPVRALATTALAGQSIAVLPLTLVVADPTLESDSLYARYKDRRTALLRADSLVAEGLQGRSPEVNWVLPPQLRKISRRAAGVVDDPDQMGQAILRAPNLTSIPDPLRSSIRSLVALSGGRLVLVPASLGFGPEPKGEIRADLSLVLADARNGKVLWRTVAYGWGASPDQALNAAMVAVLPGP